MHKGRHNKKFGYYRKFGQIKKVFWHFIFFSNTKPKKNYKIKIVPLFKGYNSAEKIGSLFCSELDKFGETSGFKPIIFWWMLKG